MIYLCIINNNKAGGNWVNTVKSKMATLSTIWNSLNENEKTQFGVSMDDRYLVISAPVSPKSSSWNKNWEDLSERKQAIIERHLAEYDWEGCFGKQNPIK